LSCVENWNCIPGIDIIDTIIGNTNIFVASDAIQNATVFAFRGSSDIQNWISNFELEFTAPYNDNSIKVHRGLYNEYLLYKDALMKYLPANKQDNVIITGHSSGGALSMFMAYDIHTDYDVTVYTFGKPRIGNTNFVESAKQIKHYRITHHNDIVPHLPEELLHYRHTNTEIWYSGDDDKYKICETNEDGECSNSCAPIHCDSIDDHKYYLMTNIGSDYC
jgi:predicted lipase